ncbi:S-adenosyl-L-methionine-dependent methyltransferase [Mycena sanguinolenta]|uniref:S-adenosyl-L-methionine-dependent methyltransferase n=1 Tax=Mycena sanguinolenta TaxID=230812 RepID=A0A8H7CM80_9AGAR|nr:S-adenosyl-L-methionine-dependent methyltransferase [Mycena sanguinolenta]
MNSLATLRALSDIIAEAVTTVERTYNAVGLNLPSLDDPLDPQRHAHAEALRRDPVVVDAVKNLVAAAGQIAAAARDPAVSILNAAHAVRHHFLLIPYYIELWVSSQFQISSCVQAASQLNVAEILREAGPEGMSVKDIAARSNVDPKLLARILRLLATHHIFREVSTDVFATNRISSTLDKGKPVDVLFEKPDERFLETTGLSALVEVLSEEAYKSAAFLTETMLDPTCPPTGHERAFNTGGNMFAWFEQHKNRLTRFNIAMKGTATEEPAETIFRGFRWQDLPAGSVIVDVGGGLGASSLSVAKKYPTLKVVNQDRAGVIEHSKAHWKEFFPEHVAAGMVEFQPHNFFEPQPVKNAAAFLLRHVMHDWPDAKATNTQPPPCSRTPDHQASKSLFVTPTFAPTRTPPGHYRQPHRDGVRWRVHPSARAEHPHPRRSPQTRLSAATPELRIRWGTAILLRYDCAFRFVFIPPSTTLIITSSSFDQVNCLVGGAERTLEGFCDVLLESGWKLVEVYHCLQTDTSHIIAEPIN